MKKQRALAMILTVMMVVSMFPGQLLAANLETESSATVMEFADETEQEGDTITELTGKDMENGESAGENM